MKIVKSLEDSGLLIKGLTKIIGNEAEGKRSEVPELLLGILGSISTDKDVIKAGKEKIRAGRDF